MFPSTSAYTRFDDGTENAFTAAVNDAQSVARLIALNAVARSPLTSQRSEYARRSSAGRSSGDSHDGGASQGMPTSATMGPFGVFHTSNGSGWLRPRTGM